MKNINTRVTRRGAVGTLAVGAAALVSSSTDSSAAASAPAMPRCSPEDAGIDPAGILAFVEAANRLSPGLHSLMLVRHGKVAAEGWWRPYAARHPHMLYSLSKSFTSTAVGFAVTEGHLTVDATVSSFFPDRMPRSVTDNLASMKVRHLLTMSTGHEQDATGPTTAALDGDWVRAFLSLPVPREPGSLFVYNSAATYMLSAIVQKVTGSTVLDYLTPRLFQPLGFDSPTWEKCPRGINTGGWGLSIRTEEIARFGQVYLRNGLWRGKQVVPAAWIRDATTKKISNGTAETSDWSQGYCYQFWRCRHGAFRGDGAFGQYCVVMPEQDAVLAITSGLRDMQAPLNLVWDHLLPAMSGSGAAPSGGEEALHATLRNLSVPVPMGSAMSDLSPKVTGRVYRMDANPQKVERLSINFERGGARLTIHDSAGERTVSSGNGKWVESPALRSDEIHAKTAAAGAWTDERTYQMKFCSYETPFIDTVSLHFDGNTVRLHLERNVGFGPLEPIVLTGNAT